MGNYRRAYGEANNILKPYKELGKAIPPFEEYKAKKDDAYKGAMTLYQMGIDKKKPSKPYMLSKVSAIGLFLVVTFGLGTQILISIWGKKSKVDDGLSGLMGAGVGVCGVSAAVAAVPVVNAKPRDFFYAIGTILLFGTLCLFTFPYIGKALDMSQPIFGAWCGTAILNTAQLVAAASWYGHEALLTANIINIVRVGFIPIIVMWAIYYYVIRPTQQAGGEA